MRYKLIDILNKIANGELKEGAKVKYKDIDLIYEDEELVDDEGFSAADFFRSKADYNEEVELIEPNHSPDIGKMAEPTDNTKIEELEAMGETKFEYGEPVPADWVMANKINEIIRYINK